VQSHEVLQAESASWTGPLPRSLRGTSFATGTGTAASSRQARDPRPSLLVNLRAGSQLLRGLQPVLVWRSLRTASGFATAHEPTLPYLVPKVRDAVFIRRAPVRQLGMLVSLLGNTQGARLDSSCPV